MTDLKTNFYCAKNLSHCTANKVSVVFQLLLDPGHATNLSHTARFNMYPCFCCHLFEQNKEKNDLVLWLFAKG